MRRSREQNTRFLLASAVLTVDDRCGPPSRNCMSILLNVRRRFTKWHALPFPHSLITCSFSNRAHMAITPGPQWQRVSAGSFPPFFMFNKPIQKSEQDDREYRIIKLENGLHATLVHDPEADSAAASLDVSVGHLSDPVSSSIDHVNSNRCSLSRMICQDSLTSVNIYCSW